MFAFQRRRTAGFIFAFSVLLSAIALTFSSASACTKSVSHLQRYGYSDRAVVRCTNGVGQLGRRRPGRSHPVLGPKYDHRHVGRHARLQVVRCEGGFFELRRYYRRQGSDLQRRARTHSCERGHVYDVTRAACAAPWTGQSRGKVAPFATITVWRNSQACRFKRSTIALVRRPPRARGRVLFPARTRFMCCGFAMERTHRHAPHSWKRGIDRCPLI